MDTDLSKEAPNVVTETTFRELINDGFQVEVVCKEDAYRKGSIWHGLWILRAINDEGIEKELITARALLEGNFIQVRTFKTVTGVVSFLMDLGFAVISVPMYKDQRANCVLPPPEDGDDG